MNNNHPNIAVDLMGGDDEPLGRLRAIKKFKKTYPQFAIQMFINQEHFDNNKSHYQNLPSEVTLVIAEHSVSMDESPLVALRKKRLSSLSMAVKALADGQTDAILTAGNSGALVAFAKYWLKSLPGIERPALATVLPGLPKPSLLLDVGATLQYNADDLYALAEMGAAVAPHLLNCGHQPEVALLNVGTEHIKGHDTVQQADRLLQQSDLNYLGFCEGTHLFKGYADVICCDGFVGNITLKACEGLMQQLQKKPSLKWWQKLLPASFWQFNDVNFNPAQYNGALLLGLDGLVVKAHGNSDETDFFHALVRTADYTQKINNQR